MARVGTAFVEIHGDFGPLKRELRTTLAGAVGDAEVNVHGDLGPLRRELAATERGFGGLDKSASKFNKSLLTTRNIVSVIKWPALIAGAGFAAQALSALGAGAVALSGALAPLSGALVAYPALLGALGQSAGVVALAGMKDLTEAMGGNEQALKRLTPQARGFLESLKGFKPQFDSLRRAAQGPLFAGLTTGLERAARNFPALRSVIRDTSQALGQLAARVGQLLGSKGFGRDFQTIGVRNTQTVSRLGRAGINLASALRHVMVAAGPLIGFMTKAALSGSRLAESFAKQGRESGRLGGFFRQTRDVLKTLGSITQSVAAGLLAIGKAGAPLGRTILKDINEVTQRFEDWAESMEGQNQLGEFFARAKGPLYETVGLISDLGKAFLSLGMGPGVQDLIAQTRTLVPVLKDVIGTTTAAFGPALVDSLRSVLVLLGDLAGTSGPLTIFVRTIGFMADALHTLLTEVPGMKQLVITLVGLRAVIVSLNFAAAVTGIRAMATSMWALSASTVASRNGMVAWTAGLAAQRVAALASAAATRVLVGAQLTLNAAMLASPYVAAAAALGIAAFLIVKHWKEIQHAGREAIDFIKDHPYVIPFGPFVVAAVAIAGHWNSLKRTAASVLGALKSGFGAVSGAAQRMVGPVVGAVSSIVSALKRPSAITDKLGGAFRLLRRVAEGSFGGIRSAVQWVIDKVRDLIGLIPKIKFPDLNPFNNKKGKARGGVVHDALTLVGEEGPELADLPRQGRTLLGRQGPEILPLPVGTRVHSHPESKRMAKKMGIQAFARGGVVKKRPLWAKDIPVDEEGRAGDWPERSEPGKQQEPRGFRAVSAAVTGRAGAMVRRADRLEGLGLKYVYGGNHYQPYNLTKGFDCSSSVSYVLGIPPRDSSGLMGYGSPGKGAVSIFANPGHVFMSLFGRGFGTSPSNPKRGPGWLDYSSRTGFTVSHLAGIGAEDKPEGSGKPKPLRGKLSLGQMVTLARKVGFADPALAAAVGYAESKGNIGAHNTKGEDSRGLWQINVAPSANPKYEKRNLFDPFVNARTAKQLSEAGGWKLWSKYRHNEYQDYLGARGKPLPSAGTTGAAAGSSYADEIAYRLSEAKGTETLKDDMRWITKGLKYWRGVKRRNLKTGNFARADEALTQIRDLKTKRSELRVKGPAAEKFTLGGLTKLKSSLNPREGWNIAGLQSEFDNAELATAQASLTSPPYEDDITAAQRQVSLWDELYKMTLGVNVPRKVYNNRGKLIDVVDRISGTIKQKTEAATSLKQAKDALQSVHEEAKSETLSSEDTTTPVEATPVSFQGFKDFSDLLRDLARQFGNNFQAKPLQSFAEGGIIQGPKNKAVVIKGHGGEAVINEDGNLTVFVKQDEGQQPQVIKQIHQTNNYPTPPPEPHGYSKAMLFELKAA